MAEDRYQLYKNFNFKVEVNGVLMSFTKVSGLERNASMRAVQEGGFNSHVHYLRDAVGTDRVLTLEYGMAESSHPLTMLSPGRYLPKGMTVMVLDDHGKRPSVTYSLDGCYVRKVRFGNLDAQSGEIIVNELEIIYNYITEIR